ARSRFARRAPRRHRASGARRRRSFGHRRRAFARHQHAGGAVMRAALVLRAFAVLGVSVLASCAGAVESSKLEDGARRTVPVPICLKPLPRHGTSGVMATLKPEDYWTTLLPGYDASAQTVDRTSADCSGRQLLGGPELLQVEGPRTGPVKVAEG